MPDFAQSQPIKPSAAASPVLLLLLLVYTLPAQSVELLGYGVRPCEDYLKAHQGWEKNDAKAVVEYFRYQDWLAGFVSGLNFTTGDDQLRGVGLAGVMRRNLIHCEDNPQDDFFTASMGLIKSLKDLP
ncbi:MAG: hypothetical protein HQL47_09810 [Gammaproteobacteria bacterium]|nr:hypothetical protein [Gammaproteobacteria bacterium]